MPFDGHLYTVKVDSGSRERRWLLALRPGLLTIWRRGHGGTSSLGLAAVELVTEGAGPNLSLRLSKKEESSMNRKSR